VALRRYNPGYRPPATLALVGVNVGIAIIDMLSGGLLERMFWARGIDIQYGQYWRLFTCGWVHADIMHIAFNAYGIYVLGMLTEQMHGWKTLLLIYLASLLGGSALAIAFMDPGTPLLGASGAAYGLFGAVLGSLYARTGSISDLWKNPLARTLLIWLAFGVYLSLRPGISMLGHLGGFVPGLVLGMFFEHRYRRELDIYHKLGAALVCAAIVLLLAFSIAPFTRSSWFAARALRAYEAGDMEAGDRLLAEADKRNRANEGSRKLLNHLHTWRTGHELLPQQYTVALLRRALTHPRGVPGIVGPDGRVLPFWYLPSLEEASESLEPSVTQD
jgi:membrane associated rhomboid family serine protease